MSYRPSSAPLVTAWARHLDKVMRAEKWSRVRLFEEVGAELGYGPKSRSALLPLLTDKEPNEAQAAILRRRFGEPEPIDQPADPPADTSLAAAIRELTGELRAAREERKALADQVEEMDEVLRTLVARTTAIEEGRDAPAHSAESAR